jgi:crotonobetainyl-CoA:carnitine CoA-transferase CaiB-like acyl-CoA transferase
MCATAFRSFEEWDKHPQGIASANSPPVALIKIGEAPKRAVHGPYQQPLEGIRVLDLTRVLAGPVCGRTLAGRSNSQAWNDVFDNSTSAHSADVLLVTSPDLPDLPLLDIETSRGKRTTQLDLNLPSDHEILTSLAQDTDVFLQAYRPGGLREKGFGPEHLAKARPGIVYAGLTAYGWEGPWKDRRGVRIKFARPGDHSTVS